MSLAQGFAQGFGMMDQYYARQDAQQFRDQQAQTEQQRYGAQMERQQKQDQLAAQQHRLGLIDKGVPTYDDGTPNFGLYQKELDQKRQADVIAAQQKAKLEADKIRTEINKNTAEITAKYASANKSQADADKVQHEVKLATMEQRNRLAGLAYQKIQQGFELSPDEVAALGDSVFAPLAKKSGEVKAMDQHFSIAQSIEDPMELMAYMNAPKTLEYVNTVFSNEIYQREQMNPGRKYRIVELDVLEGGVVPVFEVTDAKTGDVISKGPATANKSSSQSDQLRLVPISDFKGKIAETLGVMSEMEQNPMIRQYLNGGSEKGIVLGSNSMLVDPVTGVVRAENKNAGLTPRDIYSRMNAIDRILNGDGARIMPEDQKAAFRQEYEQLRGMLPQQGNAAPAVQPPTPNQSTNAPRNNAGQNAAMGVGSQDMIRLLEQLKAEGKI
jgi:hypothetical protein